MGRRIREQQLQFAHPVDDLPETHIGDWLEKNHVYIEKGFAGELRESGTMALGAGFPGIPHDDLNALPCDRWERDKDLYVYETWLKNAKARVRD